LLRFLDGSSSRVRPAVLAALAKGRIIVPENADELGTLRARYLQDQQGYSAMGITIVSSLGCNFDCPYCFETKHPSIMNEFVRRALLARIEERLPSIGALAVTWYGGEPLVAIDSLLALSDAMIQRCAESGVAYYASMVTNGFLLDRATCIALKERKVTDVQVTLDGPPHIHDRMRPLRNGKPTFARILENLGWAIDHFAVTVRVNLDRQNVDYYLELLDILQSQGFSQKINIYPGQLLKNDNSADSFSDEQFANVKQAFVDAAVERGFAQFSMPSPVATPCTAVRPNDLIVGSEGELYSCWESVGSPEGIVGHLLDPPGMGHNSGKRSLPVLQYAQGRELWRNHDPFSDSDCRECIALPVCMGGCASSRFRNDPKNGRCISFRFDYRERLTRFVNARLASEYV
jgi:uncharacterized protein